jgi:hypothetical protein
MESVPQPCGKGGHRNEREVFAELCVIWNHGESAPPEVGAGLIAGDQIPPKQITRSRSRARDQAA